MHDKLSNQQIFNKIKDFNLNIYDSIYDEDFKKFNHLIDEFEQSGIQEQENFETVLFYYRHCRNNCFINGYSYGPKANDFITYWSGINLPYTDDDFFTALITLEKYIKDKNYDEYTEEQMNADIPTPPTTQNVNKRRAHMIKYQEEYLKLFQAKTLDSTKGTLINMVEIREKYNLGYNTILFDDIVQINDDFKSMSISEQWEYLQTNLKNVYRNNDKLQLRNYIKFKNEKGIRFSNYIAGKHFSRKRWFDFKNSQYPTNVLFYLELCFFLMIPSSNKIEKILNIFGYSIHSLRDFPDSIKVGKNTHYITFKELARWIDCGIEYELLNLLFGYELEEQV